MLDDILNQSGIVKANTMLVERSKTMSKSMTFYEQLVWFNLLSSRKLLGYKFVKQKIIFNYIVDFYCSELLLIIEIDGEIHNHQKQYDETRDKFLESLKLKVVRIKNDDIMLSMKQIKYKLVNTIHERKAELKTNNISPL